MKNIYRIALISFFSTFITQSVWAAAWTVIDYTEERLYSGIVTDVIFLRGTSEADSSRSESCAKTYERRLAEIKDAKIEGPFEFTCTDIGIDGYRLVIKKTEYRHGVYEFLKNQIKEDL